MIGRDARVKLNESRPPTEYTVMRYYYSGDRQ